MKKRAFLHTAAAGAASLLSVSASGRTGGETGAGPALLTVTGAIGPGNRGGFDPALDQMMAKQKLTFDRAHAFDFAALERLPQHTIRPVIEYDERPHRLSGPLLDEVLKTAGAVSASSVLLRAIDGYAVRVEAAQWRKYRFMVATRLDGKPMALGGLGPLWAIHDADRFPELAAKPVNQRFGLCPWGLYHIHVAPG